MSEKKQDKNQDKNQDIKPDFVLDDGREIIFDLRKLKVKEWRSLFDEGQTAEEEDAILTKCSDQLDDGAISELNYLEWRGLVIAFYEAARRPLANPN